MAKSSTNRLIRFILRRPVAAIVTGVLIVAVLAPGVMRLYEDFTYRVWYRESNPVLHLHDDFERRFGNDDAVVVAVHSPSGVFDPESATLLRQLTDDMWQAPRVIRVDSLANYQWVHSVEDDIEVEPLIPDDLELTPELLAEREKVALEHEILPGYLVSDDANTAVMYARMEPQFEGRQDYQDVVAGVRDIAARYHGQGDHQIYLNGQPVLMQSFREVAFGDLYVVMPVLIGFAMLLLFAMFRSVRAVLLPLAVVGLSTGVAMAVGGLAGLSFNNMTSLIPHILIAIGLADAVHVLVTYALAVRRGMDRRDAVEYTLTKNFRPTLLTSITTAVALFSFVAAPVMPIAHLGLMAGIGALAAWLMTYLVLGGALALRPPKVPRTGAATAAITSARATSLVSWLHRRRLAVVAGFVLIAGSAGLLAARNRVSSDPFAYFEGDVPIRQATDFLEREMGAAAPIELMIDSGREEGIKDPEFLGKVAALQAWLHQRPDVVRAVSVVDVLRQTNRSLHGDDPAAYRLPQTEEETAQLLLLYSMSLPQGMDLNNQIAVKNDSIRMTILWTDRESTRTLAGIAEIEAKAAELGLDARATGKFPLLSGMQPYVVSSMVQSSLIAIVAISLLLVFALRSLRLGLVAFVANVFPLLAGGALLWLLGYDLDVGTAMTSSIVLGICVDDSIHLLANYERHRRDGMSPRRAIAEIYAHTAPALLVTTLLLVGAFATFALGSFVPFVHFGVMVAGVLAIAVVADLVFLPALLMLRDAGEERAADRVSASAVTSV